MDRGDVWAKLEAAALLLLTGAVTALSFRQDEWPLLFLPILPAMIATCRIGRLGAAGSVILVALIGGGLSAAGHGPVYLIVAEPGAHSQFFQLYLAVVLLTVLPVAAEMKKRKALFERLEESEARFRLVTENSTDIVMHLALDGTFRYVSPAMLTVAGYEPERLVGRKAQEVIEPDDVERVVAAHLQALRNPAETFIVDYRGRMADGTTRWLETHTRATLDRHGRQDGLVCTVRDISHRKEIESRLEHAATTDALTGLVNRREFTARLDELLAGGDARGGCVAVFDVDHFKSVNDRNGHEAGDEVLVAFARLAQQAVREGDVVARLGGEEFGFLLPNVTAAQAGAICDRLRRALSARPISTALGGLIRVTVSVGVAEIGPGSTRLEVLRAADSALYQAKAEGRNRMKLAA